MGEAASDIACTVPKPPRTQKKHFCNIAVAGLMARKKALVMSLQRGKLRARPHPGKPDHFEARALSAALAIALLVPSAKGLASQTLVGASVFKTSHTILKMYEPSGITPHDTHPRTSACAPYICYRRTRANRRHRQTHRQTNSLIYGRDTEEIYRFDLQGALSSWTGRLRKTDVGHKQCVAKSWLLVKEDPTLGGP